MVEKDILPISMVCGEGFQELFGYIEPNYQIPSRPTITPQIEACFAEKKELKRQLASTKFIALTTTDGRRS